MSERQKSNDLSNSLVLSGIDVCNLPATLLRSYAEKISAKLEGPNTISEPPEKLYEAMLGSRAIVSIDVMTNKLLGFAQIKKTSDEEWELRSLTSFAKEAARGVLLNGAALVYGIDAEAKVIAKVREGNEKAQKVITGTGGVLLASEASTQHYNTDGLPIKKYVYDVSFETLIPKKPQVKTSLDIVREHLPMDNGASSENYPLLSKLKWMISSFLRWGK